jgi:uncharacterized membrane protein
MGMKGNTGARLLGVAGLLVTGGLFAYNWYTLINKGYYSIKLTAAVPLLMLMSLLVIIVPRTVAPLAQLDKRAKTMVIATLAAGAVFSGVNFYAMQNYYPPVAQRPLDKVPEFKPVEIPRPSPQQTVAGSNNTAPKQAGKDDKKR